MLKIHRPKLEDAPEYCWRYFELSKEDNLLDALESTKHLTLDVIKLISPEKEDYRYAPDKWTVKMVLSHIIDCERVFTYRAMRFSRKDAIELTGFDDNTYALNSNTSNRTLNEIGEEFLAVRQSFICLFRSMTDEMLDFRGIANKFVFTPRSLGWMAAGHAIHHCSVIKDKYLK